MEDTKPNLDTSLQDMDKTKRGELGSWVMDKVTTYADARFKYERNWYLADNFWDGNHFVWWRKSTGTIDRIKPPKGTVLRQVPKLKKAFEAMANLIVANDPRWVAYPDLEAEQSEPSEQAIEYSKRRRMWLEDCWDKENMKGKTIDWVVNALKFPHAIMEVWTDPETRKQHVSNFEPFDCIWKPDVSDIDDSPIFIKMIPKRKEEVEESDIYTLPEDFTFVPENKFAQSDMKEMRMMEKFGSFGTYKDNTAILYECYIKDKNPISGEKFIRLVSVYCNQVIRNEVLHLKRYPFSVLKLQPGPYYQQSYLESLMPTNKSIDLIVSNIETFFHTMTRGKILKHKNSTVTRVTNENGDFIEYDVDKPEQMQLSSIPNYVFVHLANLEKWVEERTVSSATAGRVPRGIRAYKAIESLKQSDFANMGAPLTFLEESLERVAELILEQADLYIDKPQKVQRMNEENPDYFRVIGSRAAADMGQLDKGLIPLSGDTKVDVKMESGLSYTEEGKRQTMLELYQLKLVAPEEVLRVFRFSNVGEMLTKAQASQQVSMIDTPDFQALPDPLKKVILQSLQQMNVNIPTAPQDLNRVTRNTNTMGGAK